MRKASTFIFSIGLCDKVITQIMGKKMKEVFMTSWKLEI